MKIMEGLFIHVPKFYELMRSILPCGSESFVTSKYAWGVGD